MVAVEPFRLLCSYAYFAKTDMADLAGRISGPQPMVFGDSGAFTALTLGRRLEAADYAAWCRKWQRTLTAYANLDVIGSPDATYRNQRILEHEHGLHPVPVFHTGTPWRWLEKYIDEGHTYIALGKLVGVPTSTAMPWIAKAFRVANGRAVFHGFGLTGLRVLREFPFYSVDSSTWTVPYRLGQVRLFHRGRWVTFRQSDKTAALRHRELIREHGADPAVFASKTTYRRTVTAGLSAVAYRRFEQWLRDRHGPVRRPDASDTESGGLYMYLSDSNTSLADLLPAAQAINQYERDQARAHRDQSKAGV